MHLVILKYFFYQLSGLLILLQCTSFLISSERATLEVWREILSLSNLRKLTDKFDGAMNRIDILNEQMTILDK